MHVVKENANGSHGIIEGVPLSVSGVPGRWCGLTHTLFDQLNVSPRIVVGSIAAYDAGDDVTEIGSFNEHASQQHRAVPKNIAVGVKVSAITRSDECDIAVLVRSLI